MRTGLCTLLSLLTLATFSSNAWAKDIVNPKPFDAVLHKYVNAQGHVDYKGLQKNKKDFDAFKGFLADVARAKVKGSKNARLAFWINAYNATVISSILERYPIESVMKVKGFFKGEKHEIAGKAITLDSLENKIIRAKFHEPRVHFLLVCGAMSCPRLQQKAVTEKNIQHLLNSAAAEFVKRSTKISDDRVETSQIFNWFGGDFKKSAGSVRKFLAKYDKKHAKAILSEKHKLTFSKYDWKLNAQ